MFLLIASGIAVDLSGAVPRLDPLPGRSLDLFRLRISGEPSTAYQLQTSEDLLNWSPWLVTNSPGAQLTLEDAAIRGLPFRAYRAIATPIAPVDLRIVAPTDGARLSTDRPVIELVAPGVNFGATPPSIRANGEAVDCQCEPAAAGVRCTPIGPLPAGFVQLTAALPDTGLQMPPFDRREVLILPDDRNLPPEARADSLFATAGTPASVLPAANDRDPNGDPLSVTAVGAAAHGEVRLDPVTGGAIYTATAGYSGADAFTYTVQDARGGSATGKVRVIARPAPSIALFVDDAPASTTSLQSVRKTGQPNVETSLEVALTNICTRLRPGERGRITLRTRKPISLNRLRLGCPVDLVSEDGSPARIQGTPLAVELPAGGTLAGLAFSSGGAITLALGGDASLVNDVFQSDVQLHLYGAGSPGPALHGTPSGGGVAGAALQAGEILLQNNQFQDLVGAGDLTGNGVLGIRGGSGRSLLLGLDLEDQSRLEAEAAGFTEAYSWRLRLAGTSKVSMRDAVGVRRVATDLELTGTHETTLENVVTASGEFDLHGVATLSGRLQALRMDRMRFDAALQRLDVTSENEVYMNANLKFHTPPGSSADVSWTGRQLKFDAGYLLESDDGTRLKFEAATLAGRGPLQARARGELELRLTENVDLGGELSVDSKIGPTRVGLEKFQAKAAVNVAIHGGPLDLSLQGGVARGGVSFTAPLGSPITGLVKDVAHEQGWGGYVAAFASREFSVASAPDATNRTSPWRLSGPPASSRLRFDNVTFSGPNSSASGLTVSGLTTPVEVVNCTFSSGMPGGIGLSIAEVDAAVTVRSNRFNGTVFTADGDIEDEGRSGRIRRDYLFEGNRVNAPGNLVGLAFQDVSGVVLRGNQVVADRCLQVSAGQVVAEDNTFDAAGFAGTAIVVMAGPGGPGALVARRNKVKCGVPLMLGGGGFANFDGGNDFQPAGLLPMTSINVGGGDGQTGYAEFRGNTFGMALVTIGPGGVADFSNNTFAQVLSFTDANPRGGLVRNPTQAGNAGLIPELCSSKIDFGNDGCNDLPPRCNGRDDEGRCLCGDGIAPASAPPWPLP